MSLPSVKDFQYDGLSRENALRQLSAWIAEELGRASEQYRSLHPHDLATALIEKVESIAEQLNASGYSFGRLEYGGDINVEDSYQTFSQGQPMGTGLILEFRGFACEVSWRDKIS